MATAASQEGVSASCLALGQGPLRTLHLRWLLLQLPGRLMNLLSYTLGPTLWPVLVEVPGLRLPNHCLLSCADPSGHLSHPWGMCGVPVSRYSMQH